MNDLPEKEMFGERVQRLRFAKGLTLQKLASAIGAKSHATIQHIELGYNKVGADRLPALARALNVTIDYLVTGKEASKWAVLQRAILNSPHPDPRLVALVNGVSDNHEKRT